MSKEVFEKFMSKRYPNVKRGSPKWKEWEFAFGTGDPEFYMTGDSSSLRAYKEARKEVSKGKPTKYFYGVEVKEEELPPMLRGQY